MVFRVVEITAEQTYPLRHEILRPHQPIEMCHYPGDNVSGAFHLGVFKDESIVGIVSVAPDFYKNFKEKNQFRIRGMAVMKKMRRQHIGELLIVEVMNRLTAQRADLVWFNAREVAFMFYEALGFQYLGPLFEIEGIGPHKVMFAHIKEWVYERERKT